MAPRREVIKTDRFSIGYLAAGEGPAVVIAPAMEQTAEWWADVGYMDLLSRRHKVVVIDAVGQGGSEMQPDAELGQTEPVVNALGALFEIERMASATVWGLAGGAEFMTVLARRRPDLAAKVVVGSMYLGDPRQPFDEMRIDRRSVLERMAGALDSGDWGAYFDIHPWPATLEYQAEVRRRMDPLVLARRVRAALQRVGGFVLPGVPTFAYWSDAEPFHRANVERVEGMPLSWATLPGTMADVFMAAPEVVEVVEGFLRPATART